MDSLPGGVDWKGSAETLRVFIAAVNAWNPQYTTPEWIKDQRTLDRLLWLYHTVHLRGEWDEPAEGDGGPYQIERRKV